jgi:hypothetical protein
VVYGQVGGDVKLTQKLNLFRDGVDPDEPATKRQLDAVSAGGGHILQDEGVDLPARARMNFTGSGVTASDDSVNGQTDVVIPGDYAPASHVDSRDGHPLATASLDGFQSGTDKAKLDGIEAGALKRPELHAIAPNFTNYTLTLATNTWTRLFDGVNYAPRIDFPVLGAPPSGTAWRVDVLAVMRISAPGASSMLLGVGLGTAWAMGAVHGGVRAEVAAQVVTPIMARGLVPDPLVAFSVTAAIFASAAGDYLIITNPALTARAYLVKV